MLLVCENSKWTSYACPTCAGSTCNWKGAANGDACPHAAETQGTCNLDGRVVSCYWSTTADAGVFVERSAAGAVVAIEGFNRCVAVIPRHLFGVGAGVGHFALAPAGMGDAIVESAGHRMLADQRLYHALRLFGQGPELTRPIKSDQLFQFVLL